MEKQILISNKLEELPTVYGISKSVVGFVCSGMRKPIRSYEDKEELRVMLVMELQRLSESYGSREKMPDHVMQECLSLLESRFSMLGIEELGEAFRMSASGDLGVNIETYGSFFNSKILGSLLGAWRKYRSVVVAGIIKSEDDIMVEKARVKTVDEKNLALYDAFPQMIEDGKTNFKSWIDVPAYWYNVSRKLGLLKFEEGEADRIYLDAQALSKIAFSKDLLFGVEQLGSSLSSQVVARKLSVWRKLICD